VQWGRLVARVEADHSLGRLRLRSCKEPEREQRRHVSDQGANTLSGSHIYTASGDYAVIVTVSDDDGGSGFNNDTFTVINTLFLPMLIH
jgi:hypothetical protein